MERIEYIIGDRVRAQRLRLGFTQEELAEKSDLHPTYIGQIERGEKNPTIGTLSKVTGALGISFETLFEKIYFDERKNEIALRCYALIDALEKKEQAAVMELLQKLIDYKKI